MKSVFQKWSQLSLVKRIIIGLLIGILLGVFLPQAQVLTIFGDLFVGALKAAAPILVLFLVMEALSKHQQGKKTNMKQVIIIISMKSVTKMKNRNMFMNIHQMLD